VRAKLDALLGHKIAAAEPKAEPKAEAKAEPKAEARSEPKAETKAEPKAEAKAEPGPSGTPKKSKVSYL